MVGHNPRELIQMRRIRVVPFHKLGKLYIPSLPFALPFRCSIMRDHGSGSS